jgi:plastocyanin
MSDQIKEKPETRFRTMAGDGIDRRGDITHTFSPTPLTVPVGTTVTWVNHDEVPHTVVSDNNPRTFRSGGLDTDDKFSFNFTKAGTYNYHCSVHPHMTGIIIVH